MWQGGKAIILEGVNNVVNLPEIDFESVLPSIWGIVAGDHLAKLLGVKERESKKSGRRMWVWRWKILEGPCTGMEIVSFTDDGSTTNHPLMVGALHNHLQVMGFEDGESVDTDEYLGKKAVLMVDMCENKGKSKGKAFPYVTKILPPGAAHLTDVT